MLNAYSYKKNFTMVTKKFYTNILKNNYKEIYFDHNITKLGNFLIAVKK